MNEIIQPQFPHLWRESTVGHGHQQCVRCKITMLEAAAIDQMNDCAWHPSKRLHDERDSGRQDAVQSDGRS